MDQPYGLAHRFENCSADHIQADGSVEADVTNSPMALYRWLRAEEDSRSLSIDDFAAREREISR